MMIACYICNCVTCLWVGIFIPVIQKNHNFSLLFLVDTQVIYNYLKLINKCFGGGIKISKIFSAACYLHNIHDFYLAFLWKIDIIFNQSIKVAKTHRYLLNWSIKIWVWLFTFPVSQISNTQVNECWEDGGQSNRLNLKEFQS